METVLEDEGEFVRMDRWSEVESGVYWMAQPGQVAEPLADRAEQLILQRLRRGDAVSTHQIEEHIAESLQGLLTADHDLVMACLGSYAVEIPGGGEWELRDHEKEEARHEACAGIVDLLISLGKRLGYKVKGRDPVQWSESKGRIAYRFQFQATAAVGTILGDEADPAITLVLTGGRAGLMAEKTRRDARIRMWLDAGNCIVKFRHVRRLDEDPKLRRENFSECLNLDPAEQQDPQMHLL